MLALSTFTFFCAKPVGIFFANAKAGKRGPRGTGRGGREGTPKQELAAYETSLQEAQHNKKAAVTSPPKVI